MRLSDNLRLKLRRLGIMTLSENTKSCLLKNRSSQWRQTLWSNAKTVNVLDIQLRSVGKTEGGVPERHLNGGRYQKQDGWSEQGEETEGGPISHYDHHCTIRWQWIWLLCPATWHLCLFHWLEQHTGFICPHICYPLFFDSSATSHTMLTSQTSQKSWHEKSEALMVCPYQHLPWVPYRSNVGKGEGSHWRMSSLFPVLCYALYPLANCVMMIFKHPLPLTSALCYMDPKSLLKDDAVEKDYMHFLTMLILNMPMLHEQLLDLTLGTDAWVTSTTLWSSTFPRSN